MSCNKTKRQKSMIYDKKSDILPRLCFGLIYPPKKSGSRGMPRLPLFCRFWMHMMKFSMPRPPLGKGGAIKGINTYAEHCLIPRRPAMVGELTHMRSMCVGVAETGVEHCSPAKNHKEKLLKIKSKKQIPLYHLTAENFMP